MKLRFWQKNYLLTLTLFLLCLNAGILSLTVYTYQKNSEAVENAVAAEHSYIVKSFERDYSDLLEVSENATPLALMQSYGEHYENKGLFLAFQAKRQTLYSNFPCDISIKPQTLLHQQIEGQRHILVSAQICDGAYSLLLAKNVQHLDEDFTALMITYGLTALGVSLILALGLFFVLKTLSLPLEKLRRTTEIIEGGDFSVTAEEQGNDEFTLLAKSFNSMLSKINEQLAALETDAEQKQLLIDNLAHELRTPLTSIYGYAEYLQKAAASEENRVVASLYILSETKRLQKISDLLLDSAYIRGNPPEMTSLDLSEILRDVADKLQYKAKAHGVSLSHQTAPMMVLGNETLLSMLFYNLTENAIKACKDGDTVLLSCRESTATVEDSGKGMTSEQLAHITKPFYRTDKSRSRAEGGAGLGLALCRQIAAAHGTSLHFVSSPGNGTQVSVTFTS